MLKIVAQFLLSIKCQILAILTYTLYSDKWEKSKSCIGLDLGRIMPNVKRDIDDVHQWSPWEFLGETINSKYH